MRELRDQLVAGLVGIVLGIVMTVIIAADKWPDTHPGHTCTTIEEQRSVQVPASANPGDSITFEQTMNRTEVCK